MEKEYTVKTTCENCGIVAETKLPFGKEIQDALPQKECDNCGCKKLKKYTIELTDYFKAPTFPTPLVHRPWPWNVPITVKSNPLDNLTYCAA